MFIVFDRLGYMADTASVEWGSMVNTHTMLMYGMRDQVVIQS